MLELMDLHKRYGEHQVLKGASAVVRAGESLALLGGNGSGKTTTLRSIVGLHHLDSGSITIDGVDVERRPRDARTRVSYLPQRSAFPTTLTVREILQVIVKLRGLADRDAERELSLCGLQRLTSRTVAGLSGGERQRVALAILFMPTVGLYLLDEPTASLDGDGIRMLCERLTSLRAAGHAILFTSHVIGDIEQLATRVARLIDGRIEKTNGDNCAQSDAFQRGSRHDGGIAPHWVLESARS